jgi:hypothetical protein
MLTTCKQILGEFFKAQSLTNVYLFIVTYIYFSIFFLLFPHFTTDCEKIVLLTSEFNCSRHLIGQFFSKERLKGRYKGWENLHIDLNFVVLRN